MPDNSERNRLRYAGRIPQETLDYLTSKKLQDSRLRLWELPIFLVMAVSVILLVVLLFESHKPLNCIFVDFLSYTLQRRIRAGLRYFNNPPLAYVDSYRTCIRLNLLSPFVKVPR